MWVTAIITLVAVTPLLPLLSLITVRVLLFIVGWWLKSKSQHQRDAIRESANGTSTLQKNPSVRNQISAPSTETNTISTGENSNWEGIIGFFHPFCNAGGGGERVLWAAIAATQKRYPKAVCAVYTGDHEIERAALVIKVKMRFDITLEESTLHFVYLSNRDFVLPSTFPHFTLLGQSLGSLILVAEAFSLLVPDVFIDTMGYAFAVALCHYLFPKVVTAAYVHYPTISTDMLDSLDDITGLKGIHSGRGTGWKGIAKKLYWRMFAWIYGFVGRRIDIVMCNSTWTYGHISQIWKRKIGRSAATVVYPPCPVTQIANQIEVSEAVEQHRENIFLYIAQFRPEKNHFLILKAFAKYFHTMQQLHSHETEIDPPRLVLIGSVRSNSPDEKHIYRLRLEARDLKIDPVTTFITDAPFETIMLYLRKSNVSVNGMYSEHFGIGNVEGQAAGLILVCHNSGGPKLDICVPLKSGEPTGFLAENEAEYAEAFEKISRMTKSERVAIRRSARKSAQRFTDEIFAVKWVEQMDVIVKLWKKRNGVR